MQDTVPNLELPNLDLSKAAALQQKRTLAFVNHFVVTTVQFLNNFMKQCECKLMHFERKLEKVEAAIVLLETRLSSIPEVSSITAPAAVEEPAKTDPSPNEEEQEVTEDKTDHPETEPVASYPEYNRFVKMVQVGVPLDAVKLKVKVEGLDPSIFDKVMSSR